MSSVFRAQDTILERTVAVKILAEHLSDDERFVARFRREALAVAKLVHPNIVQVYDTGNDGGQYYIVMEYVKGKSGAQLLQSEGALDPETAVEIGVQACAGLDYAHRHGIIHRDVKPGNLMIIGGPGRARRRHDREAGRLRHRPRQRADTNNPGRLGRRDGRLPGARAGARRRGDPGLRRLLAGRRPLPVPHRPPALRGRLAGRAGGAPAVRAAAAPLLLQRRRPPERRRRRARRARLRPGPPLRRRRRAGRRAAPRPGRRVPRADRRHPRAARRRPDLGDAPHAPHPDQPPDPAPAAPAGPPAASPPRSRARATSPETR